MKILSINDFVHKFKNEATSAIKIHQVLGSNGLDTVGIYLNGGPIPTDIGRIYIQPSKVTH